MRIKKNTIVCEFCFDFDELSLESTFICTKLLPMSALFDFSSLLVVILLFICGATFTRSLYPTIFDSKQNVQGGNKKEHSGLIGLCWKASRIGERVSPYVAAACLLMAFHILFLK